MNIKSWFCSKDWCHRRGWDENQENLFVVVLPDPVHYYKPSFWMQRALGLQSVTYAVVSQGCYIVCSGGSQTESFCWEIKTTNLGNNPVATSQPAGPQWLILRCHHTCLLSVAHTSLYIGLLGRKEANNNSWRAQTASRERAEPALQVRESSACHVRSSCLDNWRLSEGNVWTALGNHISHLSSPQHLSDNLYPLCH